MVVAVIIVVIVMLVVLVHIVLVDRDASAGAAADAGTNRRGVSTIAGHDTGPGLRNEDQVPLRVRRDRMRARRLRDGLDQDAGAVDHAENCRVGRRPRAGAVWSGATPVGGSVVAP